jgi:hypothetical protein
MAHSLDPPNRKGRVQLVPGVRNLINAFQELLAELGIEPATDWPKHIKLGKRDLHAPSWKPQLEVRSMMALTFFGVHGDLIPADSEDGRHYSIIDTPCLFI